MKLLARNFYARDTVAVARDLIGKIVVREIQGKRIAGRIVETESYMASDPACHGHRGITPRNKALFGQVGHAYIYFIYGMHYALNAVAYDKNNVCAGGVLIRALEPLEGIEQMQHYRHTTARSQLTSGPGKLAEALHITKHLYGTDLTQKGDLYIIDDGFIPEAIAETPRIGISKAQEHLWRFILKNNPYLSKR